MEIILFLTVVWFAYTLYRRSKRGAAPERPDDFHITATVSTVYDTEYTPRYIESCVLSIKQYLAELEHAREEWVFGYHPDKIEREANNILKADAGHSFALKIKEQLPSIKRDCKTRYLLFRARHLSEKAEAAVAVATKQKYATEALQLLENGVQEGIADPEKLKAHIQPIRYYIAQVEIDGFIDKAKRFEFKGNKKKALEYFQDALYSVLNDKVPNADQQENIDFLRCKVEDLEKACAIEAENNKRNKRIKSLKRDDTSHP